jgi:hypothetical protein
MPNKVLSLSYPQLLAEVGRYLFGEVSWQRQLAEALQHPNLPYRGVDPQSLKKWVAGRRGVPWWVAAELLRLVQEAQEEKQRKGDQLFRELTKEQGQ